jgi:hypothetical protein
VECGGARVNDCFWLGCFTTALSSSPDPDPWDVDVASGVCGGEGVEGRGSRLEITFLSSLSRERGERVHDSTGMEGRV